LLKSNPKIFELLIQGAPKARFQNGCIVLIGASEHGCHNIFQSLV
jgi:hypothetical protein